MIRNLILDVATIAFGLTLALATWWGARPPPDPAWDRIQARGELRIGTDATYPPFETITNGEYSGYDIALGRALAAGLGVRARFVNISLDGLYDALAQDQVDVLISALPLIWERQKEVYYSRPYYNAGPRLVVRTGEAGIAGPEGLAGRTVAVELGSEADLAARRLQRAGVALHLAARYPSSAAALAALAAGQADAAIGDPLTLAAYLADQGGAGRAGVRTLGPPLADQPYVIALRAPAPRLGPALDDLLAQLRADGRLEQMYGD